MDSSDDAYVYYGVSIPFTSGNIHNSVVIIVGTENNATVTVTVASGVSNTFTIDRLQTDKL